MSLGHLLGVFAALGMGMSGDSPLVYADRMREPRLTELRQGSGGVAWNVMSGRKPLCMTASTAWMPLSLA